MLELKYYTRACLRRASPNVVITQHPRYHPRVLNLFLAFPRKVCRHTSIGSHEQNPWNACHPVLPPPPSLKRSTTLTTIVQGDGRHHGHFETAFRVHPQVTQVNEIQLSVASHNKFEG